MFKLDQLTPPLSDKHRSPPLFFLRECNMHPLNFAECPYDTRYHSYSGKGYSVTGWEQWSGSTSHIARENRINQSFTFGKVQVAVEALLFHNAVRVSMISPCLTREALSAQPTDLIKAPVNQWSATASWSLWYREVNAARMYPTTVLFLENPENHQNSEGSEWFTFRGSVSCSWENHVSVCTVCASIWAENILSFCWLRASCFLYCVKVWGCACA